MNLKYWRGIWKIMITILVKASIFHKTLNQIIPILKLYSSKYTGTDNLSADNLSEEDENEEYPNE